MRRAWAAGSAEGARHKLRELALRLEEQHPGATSSLLEGLEETLAILRLGVGASLASTLRSTNPVENLQESLKRVARNVKLWRGGSMALRWAASGLTEALKGSRRVKGYHDMPLLIAALESMVGVESVDKNVKVA
jgi:hypothetical protein